MSNRLNNRVRSPIKHNRKKNSMISMKILIESYTRCFVVNQTTSKGVGKITKVLSTVWDLLTNFLDTFGNSIKTRS